MNPRIAADLALGDFFQPSTSPRNAPKPAKVVLLTGSTGFLGAHLLQDLLTLGNLDEIVCLVRAADDTQASARVAENLVAHAPFCKVHAERVRAVAGDISKPRLGLSDSAFDRIARAADAIYHCAAQVNLVYPYRYLRTINVLGTSEVLKLATLSAGKTLHHISSLAVPAAFGTGDPVLEAFFVPGNEGVASGYLQSKWVAEQLVNAAAASGLPVCIYRPGVITGHSHSGVCNPHDALSLMLRACIQLRAAPDSWDPVHLTPVDYVSRAICQLSLQPDSAGKAFHLVNRRFLSWRQIAETMSQCGYIDTAIPNREWLACLRKRASAGTDVNLSALAGLLSDTQDAGRAEPRRYDDTNTRNGLAAAPHVRCPDDDIVLLKKQLEWLRTLNHGTSALPQDPSGS